METHFRQTRWRAGYRPDEVDAFVARVEQALQSSSPSLSAADVAAHRFTPVRLMTGYHPDDVDDYLHQAQQQLAERGHDA
jgi:DivIVA domain-containing protein